MSTSIDPDLLQTAIEERFACRRCGDCCKGDGVVRFGPEEAERMARALRLSRTEFLDNHALVGEPGRQWWLCDRFQRSPLTGEREQWCIFLRFEADGRYSCALNQAKPDQCHRFPAQWRNPDSLKCCAGLRRLVGQLKRNGPE